MKKLEKLASFKMTNDNKIKGGGLSGDWAQVGREIQKIVAEVGKFTHVGGGSNGDTTVDVLVRDED